MLIPTPNHLEVYQLAQAFDHLYCLEDDMDMDDVISALEYLCRIEANILLIDVTPDAHPTPASPSLSVSDFF